MAWVTVVGVIGAAANSTEEDDTIPERATDATVTTATANCLAVHQSLAREIGGRKVAAVVRNVQRESAGLLADGTVWYVSTDSGATWVTNHDPTRDLARLVLPLNDKARRASDFGADVPPNAPAYRGVSDVDKEAEASRVCARLDPASVVIPDSSGKPVAPQPNAASSNPDKAWTVPDAAGTTDNVSAADALYLAAARPAVPYRGDSTVSNATLIALGKRACSTADSYTAGGVTVTGAGARAVHDAAVANYC